MAELTKGWLTLAIVGLIIVGLAFSIQGMPSGFLAIAAGIAWTNWSRPVPFKSFFWGRPAVLTGLFFVAGEGTAIALQHLYLLAHGVATERLVIALGGAVAAMAAVLFLHRIFKGELMPSIFDIASNPEALQAFVTAPAGAAPAGEFLDLDGLDQADAGAALRERVIGQDAIIQDLTGLIFRRTSLRRKGKPTGVVMFAGATGAGKTELAKALAEVLADGRLIRVDCNEMTESSSTQRLIGAPPGYLGSDQGGWLCRQLGEKRTGILLFDEIEKAHPDVFKLLMGLFDEGRLTEQSTGQTYNAQGFLIVLTTNAEHQRIAEIVRGVADLQDRSAQVKDTLQSVFKPEQLARVDEVYSFGELSRVAVAEIVGKFLFSFAADVGVTLESVDSALLIDLIARREKLKNYGIREVIRMVEKAVLNGMLDARAAGHKAVRIITDGDRVRVIRATNSTNGVRYGNATA